MHRLLSRRSRTVQRGLLLLTNDGRLQARIANPKQAGEALLGTRRGHTDAAALKSLQTGVLLNDGMTRPAGAASIVNRISGHAIRPRAQTVPDAWLELV